MGRAFGSTPARALITMLLFILLEAFYFLKAIIDPFDQCLCAYMGIKVPDL